MKRLQGMILVLILMVTSFGAAAYAGEETAGDYFRGMGIQVGRGIWNVVSSPAEIPCTMTDDIQTKGGVGAATGFGKGLAFFVRRVVVGVCEIATFVMPAPPVLPNVCTKPADTAKTA